MTDERFAFLFGAITMFSLCVGCAVGMSTTTTARLGPETVANVIAAYQEQIDRDCTAGTLTPAECADHRARLAELAIAAANLKKP
jgi:hypothetical protein